MKEPQAAFLDKRSANLFSQKNDCHILTQSFIFSFYYNDHPQC